MLDEPVAPGHIGGLFGMFIMTVMASMISMCQYISLPRREVDYSVQVSDEVKDTMSTKVGQEVRPGDVTSETCRRTGFHATLHARQINSQDASVGGVHDIGPAGLSRSISSSDVDMRKSEYIPPAFVTSTLS